MWKMANGTLSPPPAYSQDCNLQGTPRDGASFKLVYFANGVEKSESNFINKKYLSTFCPEYSHHGVFAYDNFSSQSRVLRGVGASENYGKMNT